MWLALAAGLTVAVVAGLVAYLVVAVRDGLRQAKLRRYVARRRQAETYMLHARPGFHCPCDVCLAWREGSP
jgi:hypothetical protein